MRYTDVKILLCSFLLFCFPFFSFAEPFQKIEWQDLIPQEHRTADPLAALSQKDREKVEWIIYLRMNLPEKITEKEQNFYNIMTAALPKLKERGIDVDEIIAQRQAQTTSLNDKLNKKRAQISGYLLPIDLVGNEVREFFLVPFVGACIHVPPPPPNQIIYATSEKAITFNMNAMFKPITVTGLLVAKSDSRVLFLKDGADNVDTGYVMTVETVSDYKQE